ncbi:MAG: hypothetical protein NTX61_01800 [Bacteroidetes bacterium]|nr:hypothetical protein [Bacteroidota bacterium]
MSDWTSIRISDYYYKDMPGWQWMKETLSVTIWFLIVNYLIQ